MTKKISRFKACGDFSSTQLSKTREIKINIYGKDRIRNNYKMFVILLKVDRELSNSPISPNSPNSPLTKGEFGSIIRSFLLYEVLYDRKSNL